MKLEQLQQKLLFEETREDVIYELMRQGWTAEHVHNLVSKTKNYFYLRSLKIGLDSEKIAFEILNEVPYITKIKDYTFHSDEDIFNKWDKEITLDKKFLTVFFDEPFAPDSAYLQIKSSDVLVNKFRDRFGYTKKQQVHNLAERKLVVLNARSSVNNFLDSLEVQLLTINRVHNGHKLVDR